MEFAYRSNLLVKAVEMSSFISLPSFWIPDSLVESAWTEHAPFAFWLVGAQRPRVLVELGTHYGFSFLAFAQAIKQLGISCQCFAIDTWKGDEHSGYYGDEVYQSLFEYNARHYSSFSQLVRSTFDDAVNYFEDGSIDLLHIDGRHFLEDVQHDFETWESKLSERAVVLFHDISARERDFGVCRLWRELHTRRPSFEFVHGWGLGVLAYGNHVPEIITSLCAASEDPELTKQVREAYARLGVSVQDLRLLLERTAKLNETSQGNENQAHLGQLLKQIAEQTAQSEKVLSAATETSLQHEQMLTELAEVKQERDSLRREVSQLNSARERLEGECSVNRITVAELREQVGQHQQSLKELTEVEAERDCLRLERTDLLSEIFQKMADRQQMRSELWNAKSELASLQYRLSDKTTAEDKLRSQLTDTIERSSRLKEETSHLQRQLWAGIAEVSAIEHSLSWRLTAPFRKVGAALPERVLRVVKWTLGLSWHEKQRRLIQRSGLFDRGWYLGQNADVAATGNDPIEHYLLWGGFEGRDPSPNFDSDWYLAQNPDVANVGINPLVHYATSGRSEGRHPLPPSTLMEVPAQLTASPTKSAPATSVGLRPRIVFISGEASTAGHRYRILNIAEVLSPKFYNTTILCLEDLPHKLSEIADCDILWVWRAPWSDNLAKAYEKATANGAKIIYDVDDLMFRPELANVEIIDGIRSNKQRECDTRDYYIRIREAIVHAGHFTAPTLTLVQEARRMTTIATVIPNGFERDRMELSRYARDSRKERRSDEIVRIGYLSGSRTHQKDLALASRAIAAVLKEFPKTRLVLIKDTVALSEFPEFNQVHEQIEWRELVPHSQTPLEYARFEISIAPVEVGNPFCEAKSELKYYEAALVGVATIASPTQPYLAAICHGKTGLLANTTKDWYDCLRLLVADSDLRKKLADAALEEVVWLYGPERRGLLVTQLVNELMSPSPAGSQLFAHRARAKRSAKLGPVNTTQYKVVYQSIRASLSVISVVVPLYNYEKYVVEALDSIKNQTFRELDLVIVDDCSRDESVRIARQWLEKHGCRFNRATLLQNDRNSGLGRSRNTGVGFAETEFYFPLDPDNILLPECLEECFNLLEASGAAFAYPTIQEFGDNHGTRGHSEYNPAFLQNGNYIGAMALVRRACWVAVGGYCPMDPPGWEDYEFWCKLAELGFYGVSLARVAALYRVHQASMLKTATDVNQKKRMVVDDILARHPWLELKRE